MTASMGIFFTIVILALSTNLPHYFGIALHTEYITGSLGKVDSGSLSRIKVLLEVMRSSIVETSSGKKEDVETST